VVSPAPPVPELSGETANQYGGPAPGRPRTRRGAEPGGIHDLFFAETFCSGVPVSHLNPTTGDITYGVPLTTASCSTPRPPVDAALVVAGTITDATDSGGEANLCEGR